MFELGAPNTDCFAYMRKNGRHYCIALTHYGTDFYGPVRCMVEPCPFYKTAARLAKEQEESRQRLRELGSIQSCGAADEPEEDTMKQAKKLTWRQKRFLADAYPELSIDQLAFLKEKNGVVTLIDKATEEQFTIVSPADEEGLRWQ